MDQGDQNIEPDLKKYENSFQVETAPLPGWGPRGQGPSKNRQGTGKNNWTDVTDHVPSGLPEIFFGILGHFWYLKIEKTKWQPCVPWRLT